MVYTMDSLVVGPMCKNELQVEPLPGIGFLITYKGKRVTVKISKDMSVICEMHLPNKKRSRVRLQPKHTVEQLGDAHTTARFEEHEQGYDAWNQPHLGAVDSRFSSESFKLFIDHLFAADHPNQSDDDDDGSGGGNDGGDQKQKSSIQAAMEAGGGRKVHGTIMKWMGVMFNFLMLENLFTKSLED
jgi:hypothetical protein